jgi:hypothetical protein
MKKTVLSIIVSFTVFISIAQTNLTDKIFKQSGEVLEIKILKITDVSIIYKYPDKDLQESISKLAVEQIIYASGVKEKISDKLVINGKEDWEKVQIIEDKSQLEGLKKGSEIEGKTSAFNYRSADASGKKALERLKEKAAELHAPFIFLSVDHDTQNSGGFGAKGLKKGILYTYN